ncbi:RmlC-like cupin [Bimuria novae-zelandiae CBS 107.79]|uniref:RmlC-like cupin n=1 Tax=Bimuria novae-zelandiae CBS 107.79 TaxID=1447943 RepID=A0A6A5UPF9_9PLEO|nr:RmlC-like cupin [Bimuria novae-zelandiae CBS 107.79]
MFAFITFLVLTSTSLASPLQKVLADGGGPPRPNDPDFPLLAPLPFNTTLPGIDYDLIAKLRTSPNSVTRHALLQDDTFKFDFINPPDIPFATLKGRGGTLVNAFSITMPALVSNGAAAAIGFTKPCGFNTPYTHNRATELAIVVKGRMITEFVTETGTRKIRAEHSTYSMAVFPQGALHLEFNPDCDEMVFVATFNDEDPGLNTPAESLFLLNGNFAGLALGLEFLKGADIDKFRHLVPATLAQGVESCLRRCGIAKNKVEGGEL